MKNRLLWWFRNLVRREVDLYLRGTVPKDGVKSSVQDATGEQANDDYVKDMLDRR